MFHRFRRLLLLGLAFFSLMIAFKEKHDQPSFAQSACTAPVAEIIQSTAALCQAVPRGGVCSVEGEIGSLSEVESFSTTPAAEDGTGWGMSLARIGATLPATSSQAVTLALVGDATLTNSVTPELASLAETAAQCIVTNRNNGEVNIFAAPGDETALGVLAVAEKVSANGRSEDGEWLRIEREGVLGWVAAADVAISCDKRADLDPAEPGDVSALYTETMQSFTLESRPSGACAEAPDGLFIQAPLAQKGRVLVNGAQIDLSGSAFVMAQENDELTVIGLAGQVTVTAAEKTVQVIVGSQTSVPMAALAATGQPIDPIPAEDVMPLQDLHNSLFGGQPYLGVGSTLANYQQATVTEVDVVRLNMNFTGDASICPAEALPSKLDVALVIEASQSFSPAELDAARAAAAEFIQGLNPATDRAAVLSFDEEAVLHGGFGMEAQTLIDGLNNMRRGSPEGRLEVGLSAAYTELKKLGAPEEATQAIILLTDGGGDAAKIEAAAALLQEVGVRVVVIGLEAEPELFRNVVSRPEDFHATATALNLAQSFENAFLSLKQPLAARDFTLTYTLDNYTVAEELVAVTGGEVLSGDTVQWQVPFIWHGQTLEFPLGVQGEGATIGSAEISYLACGTTEVQTVQPIATPLVASEETDLTLNRGVLALGASSKGLLSPFEQTKWLVNPEQASLLTVVTEGNAGGVKAFWAGSPLEPLYSLRSLETDNRTTNVFHVPEGGLNWLFLQGTQTEVAGTYTLAVNEGADDTALQTLIPDGEAIQDRQLAGEGRVYGLEAQAGDLLTVRFSTDEPVLTDESPLRVFGLDAQAADELFTVYDPTTNQWISLVQVQGEGPYRVLVNTSEAYTLAVDQGDTLTNARGELQVGEFREQQAKGDSTSTAVFTYTLSPEEQGVYSLVLTTLQAPQMSLRTSAGKVLQPFRQVTINGYVLHLYNLAADDYQLYLETQGDYAVSFAEGDITQSLKNTLNLGSATNEVLGEDDRLAVYNIAPGIDQPLEAGDIVSLRLRRDSSERALFREPNAFIEAADGTRSFVMMDLPFVQDERNANISVHQLNGPAPYRVVVLGMSEFQIAIERGDVLSNERGDLFLNDPTFSDSSIAAGYMVYNLSPQVGKTLAAGDVITIRYNATFIASVADLPRFLPYVKDGKDQKLRPQEQAAFGSVFVATYTLQGVPPYRLVLPNTGAFEVSATIGDSLRVDNGDLEIDDFTPAFTANDAQVVEHHFEGEDGQTVTVAILRQDEGGIGPGRVLLENQAGDRIRASYVLPRSGLSIRVYELQGEGPYKLSFGMRGTYQAFVLDGDLLTIDKGAFFVGDAESQVLSGSADSTLLANFITYDLGLTAGQTVSLDVEGADFYLLLNPNGFRVSPIVNVGSTQVFEIRDTGEHELLIAAEEAYILRVTDGDVLTVEKGNAYFSDTEDDELLPGQFFAEYTIAAEEGDIISVVTEAGDPRAEANPIIFQDITDSEGAYIARRDRIASGTYVAQNYVMTGPGPYTLTLFTLPELRYRLTIFDGDAVTVPQGQLLFDQQVTHKTNAVTTTIEPDEGLADLVPNAQIMTYELEAQAGDEITVEVTHPAEREGEFYFISLRNADRKTVPTNGFIRVPPEDEGEPELFSYTLVGSPPYTLRLGMRGEYKVVVRDADLLTQNAGELPLNPQLPLPGAEESDDVLSVEGPLPPPQRIAAYTLSNSQPGEYLSLVGEFESGFFFTLLDGAGKEIFPFYVEVNGRDTFVAVYYLTGEAPYLYKIENTETYKFTFYAGNILNALLGSLGVTPLCLEFPDEGNSCGEAAIAPQPAENQLEFPFAVAIYDILGVSEGEIISIDLEVAGRECGRNYPRTFLVNQANEIIASDIAICQDDEASTWVYTLKGAGPYRFLFTSREDHSVLLTRDDKIRYQVPQLLPNAPAPLPEDFEPYTNELPAPTILAQHTLDVPPGETVTLRIDNGANLSFLSVKDGEGNVLKAEILDFQDPYIVAVYLLSGEAPYTLSFLALDGEYSVIVQEGNQVRVEEALPALDTPVEKELDDPGRVVNFNLAVDRGETVSFKVQADGDPISSFELRDANGRIWRPEYGFERNDFSILVYELAGPPPYDFIFVAEEEYNFTVSSTDLIFEDQGILSLGAETPGELAEFGVAAVYSIPSVQADRYITVELSDASRGAVYHELRDAAGQLLVNWENVEKDNKGYTVYYLTGEAPYELLFYPEGEYTVAVYGNNRLEQDFGVLPVREEKTDRTNAPIDPAELFYYTIEGNPNDLVTVKLQVQGVDFAETLLQMLDGSGELVFSEAVSSIDRFVYAVYRLGENPPYRVRFRARNQPYRITLFEGNMLRADYGVLRFGNTFTDSLVKPAQVSYFTVDAQPDDLISLRIEDRNNPIPHEVRDADGNVLVPLGTVSRNNDAAYSAYRLYGKAPYFVSFNPVGNFGITLNWGDFRRTEFGVVPFGEPQLRQEVKAPAQYAVYTLNTEADQTISVRLESARDRDEILPTIRLLNAEGEVIEPKTVLIENNTVVTLVYDLEGSAPYSFEFKVNGQYNLLFTRGDASDADVLEVGPGG